MKDSGQLLQIIHTGMVKAGLDVDTIYRQLGYHAEKLPLREIRTEHALQTLFWQVVEQVSGDPEVGLHLCPHLPVFHGEVLEYLIFSSQTLGEGVGRSLKYLRLLSDAMNLRIVQDTQGSRAVVQGGALDAPQLRHTEICVLYELIAFSKSVTDRNFAPQKVRLRFSRRIDQADYEKVFGCPVEFDAPESEIWFDARLLGYRSPRWDPDLLKLHEELAEKRLSNLKRQDLIEGIRKVFSQRLELDKCDLEDVARELGVPTRRLRFELSRAGTSFSQVLADFRYALARKLLRSTDEPIENIVYLTGFSEPSTFYRAFKRWSGITPVQYRESRRQRMSRVEAAD
ncbi:AraC family transcriptional regulator [Solimonas sp. K1W22B-7]|uniref:AraC family transcriptional regulator n=1 Tax=Solimonas sp. K1W22B-7 TaxID=2303331 RepID=UPI000E336775|nr:AraC family transcriptional regulator [Solimonas sp. K1W22B-7]AXQ30290.1 AraC family transcriptional regulator [Solimonas sp. K1W22B-7]